MGSARFGKVLTAMVTPFDDDGALDPDGAARWPAGWWTRATTAWCWPAPPARPPPSATTRRWRCGERCGPRSTCRCWRAPAATTPATAVELPAAGRGDRRRRPAGGVAVLQPAPAGRASRPTSGPWPPPPTCRSSCTTSRPAPAGRSTIDTLVRLAREVPTIVGAQGRRGQPGRRPRDRRRGARRLRRLLGRRRRSPWRCWRWAPSASSAWHPLGRRPPRRDDRRLREGRLHDRPRDQRPPGALVRASRAATPGSRPGAAKAALAALGQPAGSVPPAAAAAAATTLRRRSARCLRRPRVLPTARG